MPRNITIVCIKKLIFLKILIFILIYDLFKTFNANILIILKLFHFVVINIQIYLKLFTIA
jgi:hypothetical protein